MNIPDILFAFPYELSNMGILDILYENKNTVDIQTLLRDTNINADITTTVLTHDKLMDACALDRIMTGMNVNHDTLPTIIINHTLNKNNNTAIIDAYANQYHPLYNNIVSNIAHPKFIDAVTNGMHVTEIRHTPFHTDTIINELLQTHPTIISSVMQNLHALTMHDCTDAILSMCNSITKLKLNITSGITTCNSFAKTLKILHAYGTSDIGDDGLSLCTNIEVLHATANGKITTCDSFSQTLRVLYVSTNRDAPSGINDYGIRLCTNIEKLYACGNEYITTCAPFAKSLKLLSAPGSCAITDSGLRQCIFIQDLNISGNMNITTLAPFARSLRRLLADRRCGITNHSLRICNSIEILSVDYNDRITTCAPFAKSLRVLSANCYHDDSYGLQCGMTDDGLRLCTNIRYLFADNNSKITTCKPFADILRMVSAKKGCGISDDALKVCTNIKNKDTRGNPNIVAFSGADNENINKLSLRFFWLY